ncbi:hypothetical protein ZWY2020_007400 [Hordeum vulgare]|nr:hypothetical protein ZWY2020_007400 [Hordeum vulgare]
MFRPAAHKVDFFPLLPKPNLASSSSPLYRGASPFLPPNQHSGAAAIASACLSPRLHSSAARQPSPRPPHTLMAPGSCLEDEPTWRRLTHMTFMGNSENPLQDIEETDSVVIVSSAALTYTFLVL